MFECPKQLPLFSFLLLYQTTWFLKKQDAYAVKKKKKEDAYWTPLIIILFVCQRHQNGITDKLKRRMCVRIILLGWYQPLNLIMLRRVCTHDMDNYTCVCVYPYNNNNNIIHMEINGWHTTHACYDFDIFIHFLILKSPHIDCHYQFIIHI